MTYKITLTASQTSYKYLGYRPWRRDTDFFSRLETSEISYEINNIIKAVIDKQHRAIFLVNFHTKTLINTQPLFKLKKKAIPHQTVFDETTCEKIKQLRTINDETSLTRVFYKETIRDGVTPDFIFATNRKLRISFKICRDTFKVVEVYKPSSNKYTDELINAHKAVNEVKTTAIQNRIQQEGNS